MNTSDAYEYAWRHASRNPDGSIIEGNLVRLVAEHIDYDVDRAKLGLAQRIVARRKRPGQTASDGQVCFPGMELYGYEPQRLLADDAGNVIENKHARVKFKAAEAKRAQQDVVQAADRAAREQNELGHFSVWAADELAAGRPQSEVTWDTCVRETGLWKDVPPTADESVESDQDES